MDVAQFQLAGSGDLGGQARKGQGAVQEGDGFSPIAPVERLEMGPVFRERGGFRPQSQGGEQVGVALGKGGNFRGIRGPLAQHTGRGQPHRLRAGGDEVRAIGPSIGNMGEAGLSRGVVFIACSGVGQLDDPVALFGEAQVEGPGMDQGAGKVLDGIVVPKEHLRKDDRVRVLLSSTHERLAHHLCAFWTFLDAQVALDVVLYCTQVRGPDHQELHVSGQHARVIPLQPFEFRHGVFQVGHALLHRLFIHLQGQTIFLHLHKQVRQLDGLVLPRLQPFQGLQECLPRFLVAFEMEIQLAQVDISRGPVAALFEPVVDQLVGAIEVI